MDKIKEVFKRMIFRRAKTSKGILYFIFMCEIYIAVTSALDVYNGLYILINGVCAIWFAFMAILDGASIYVKLDKDIK